MLSKVDMANILAIDDRKERDAAIDALSDADARKMLKKLVNAIRIMHDPTGEAGKL